MTTRKTATDNGFIIFKDQLSLLDLIPNEQLGEAIKLLLNNFDDLPPKENIAYELIASNIRRYREQAIKSSTCGKLGGNPNLKHTHKGQDKGWDKGTDKQQYKTKQDNNINNNIINNKIPPTLDEINSYIREKNLNVDGKRFFDYYSEGGWKDRDGKPIKNWKQKMLAVWDKPKNDEGIKPFW